MTRLCGEGEAVETWGEGETLAGFVWRGVSHRIDDVCNHWRIHTNWWQQGLAAGTQSPSLGSTWREYLKVTTDTGLLCLLFRKMEGGRVESPGEGAAWYLARIYD